MNIIRYSEGKIAGDLSDIIMDEHLFVFCKPGPGEDPDRIKYSTAL